MLVKKKGRRTQTEQSKLLTHNFSALQKRNIQCNSKVKILANAILIGQQKLQTKTIDISLRTCIYYLNHNK